MLSNTEFTMRPDDCLEVYILPILPSSNGYQHIITMMVVFSRYLFAYPIQDMTAKTVARCIIDVMTTLLFTNRHINLYRITVQIIGNKSDSPDTRHTDKPRINETCSNNQHTRKKSCLPEDFIKNIIGRETFNVA